MSYPNDPRNVNVYLHTETFNYTRNQPLHELMNRPEIRVVDYRDYPDPYNQQVTARIRLRYRQYTSAGLISELRRRYDWDVTVLNAVEISVTGYPTRTGDGQREFLERVRDTTGDCYAELC